MIWEDYVYFFEEKAYSRGISERQLEWALAYAKVLHDQGLPIIYEQVHFSKLVGVSLEYFYRYQKNPKEFYKTFQIKKKKKGYRTISTPLPNLKKSQFWIHKNILSQISPNPYIKSYIKKRSTISNAKIHRNQKFVLNLDIKAYFDSITSEMVFNFFKALGYNTLVADILTLTSTHLNALPQGAPTSPLISNLVTSEIDYQIFEFCHSKNIRYSRYADDMTFSGDFDSREVIKKTSIILEDFELSLNLDKIKLFRNSQQQSVTGIVVNEKLSIRRKAKKLLRQELFYIKKFGFDDHVRRKNISQSNYLNHLIGKCLYYLSVEKNNIEIRSYLKYLRKLEESYT